MRSAQREVQKVLATFVGQIEQIPPAHSAVHVNGQRAYALARAGEEVKLSPRTVTIHKLNLLRYDWPVLELDVHCGCGTYIRALARDLGQALGVGGYCSALTRSAVGAFTLDTAVAFDDLDPARDLLPPLLGLDIPTICVNASAVAHLRHGRGVEIDTLPPLPEADEIALLDADDQLLAIAQLPPDENLLRPSKVFIAQ